MATAGSPSSEVGVSLELEVALEPDVALELDVVSAVASPPAGVASSASFGLAGGRLRGAGLEGLLTPLEPSASVDASPPAGVASSAGFGLAGGRLRGAGRAGPSPPVGVSALSREASVPLSPSAGCGLAPPPPLRPLPPLRRRLRAAGGLSPDVVPDVVPEAASGLGPASSGCCVVSAERSSALAGSSVMCTRPLQECVRGGGATMRGDPICRGSAVARHHARKTSFSARPAPALGPHGRRSGPRAGLVLAEHRWRAQASTLARSISGPRLLRRSRVDRLPSHSRLRRQDQILGD